MGPLFTTSSAEPVGSLSTPEERAVASYGWNSVRFVEELSAGKRRSGFPGDVVRAVLVDHPLPLFGYQRLNNLRTSGLFRADSVQGYPGEIPSLLRSAAFCGCFPA